MIRALFCLLSSSSRQIINLAEFFCSKLGLSLFFVSIKKRTRRNDDEEEYHQYHHHHQDFEDDEVDDGGRERRGDDDDDDDDAKDIIIIEIIEIIVIIFNGIDDGRVLESNRRRGDPGVVLAGRARVANRKGVLPAPGR